MALLDVFKKKKEAERFAKKAKQKGAPVSKKEPAEKQEKGVQEPPHKKSDERGGVISSSGITLVPHITEKATFLSERGVYVFKIKPEVNKKMVEQAVREIYKVTPRKIAISYLPSKKRFVRGRYGEKKGLKKAVVYLKEGDKIEI